MMNDEMGHPGDEGMLRYADGELSEADAGRIRLHLETCGRCRGELEDLRATLSACAHYHQVETRFPPPAPWGDLSRQLATLDEAPSAFARLCQALRSHAASSRRWTVAALALACAVIYWVTDTPSARAEQLLRKAAAVESAKPAPRRIQIRSKTRTVTRRTGALPAPSDVSDRDTWPSLEAQFRAANYSWEDPLSARSFMEWRDRLPEKRDDLVTDRSGYQVRTTTHSSELVEATLKLRAEDLRATEGTLEFRNHERVEISELPEEAAPSSVASVRPEASSDPHPELPRTQPGDSAATVAATPGGELRVFAALRRLGADMGEPIEVTRTERQILVAGVGLDPQRAREIQDALSSLPNVAVRFSEPAPAPVSPNAPEASSPGASSEAARLLRSKLEAQLGGRGSLEQFAEQALEGAEALMTGVHALRRLSQRFAPETESQLNAEERRLLEKLRGEL
ncbi:MAG: zf-HC2 domain-containing protein, partial [Candidatus Solibacter usitatus]|nr:zf-HC2 domain-containing protein [Candidatus Solibacter usitatus]